LTLYRTNSNRNRQIDEFADACFKWEPADRSVNVQFCPMILKAYLNVKKDHGEPVQQHVFDAVLSWFCMGGATGVEEARTALAEHLPECDVYLDEGDLD
jgi:hypothetical protein